MYYMLIAQAGEPYRALRIFRDLQAAGFRPNLVTWCGLISGLGRQCRKGVPFQQQAYDLWHELKLSGTPLDDKAAYCTGKCVVTTPGLVVMTVPIMARMLSNLGEHRSHYACASVRQGGVMQSVACKCVYQPWLPS